MSKKLSILLIEDDQIEIMKFYKTIATSSITCNIEIANNGEDALILLSEKQFPDIILLDLNMPKINGIKFLKTLKNDTYLKYIPVILLTTSNNPVDLLECYKTGIAGYLIKPLKYNEYVSNVSKTILYWNKNELISID